MTGFIEIRAARTSWVMNLFRNIRRVVGRLRNINGFCETVLLFWVIPQSCGQGTIQITFDGPPPQPPGTSYNIQQYYESGMWFRPIEGPGSGNILVRAGGGRESFAENGTAYLLAGLEQTLQFSFTNGLLFQMFSVDLAEFSTLYQEPLLVHFIGYRADGSIVTTELTTDGIIDGTGPLADFETFYFDKEWTDLTRVEIPTYGWSLDNLVVATIPEPATRALLLTGGLLLWKRCRPLGREVNR